MATEDFKETMIQLLKDYIVLMTEKTGEYKIGLSFKEYVKFYLDYEKINDVSYSGFDLENEEDILTEEEEE